MYIADQLALCFFRGLAIVGALVGAVGISLGARLVIDWLAEAAGYELPRKHPRP